MDLYEKKYKEAQKWIESIYLDLSHEKQMEAEAFFPEIAESKDEKIRKWLIRTLKSLNSSPVQIDGSYEMMLPAIDWLERQGEDKKEINVFDVLPGLYKCVHRMFDGTPDGRLLFEVGNVYKCLSKHDRAEFEVSYGHSVYLEDPVVCKHFVPFENKSEKKSADKAEPKFHEGDWVILTAGELSTTLQIVNVDTNKKLYWFNDSTYLPIVDEECLHHWTIQDAKNGDVLINWNNTVFIFKAIEDETVKFHIAYNEKWDTVKTPSTKLSHLGLPEPQFEFHPATKEQRNTFFAKMHEVGYEWDAEKKELKKIENEEHNGENDGIDSLWHAKNILEKTLDRSKEQFLSFQIQAYLNTASDELYAKGKPLYSEERLEEIHKCMLMWQTLHNAYFYHNLVEWSEEDECYMSECIGAIATKDGWSFEEKRKTKHWLESIKQRIGG